MNLKSVTDAPVSGKRVLLRTSLNVPVDSFGNISDMSRLERGLPTLRFLSQNAARIVIAGYFGRDGESLRKVANALSLVSAPIRVSFFGGAIADAAAEIGKLKEGECLVLENMRSFSGEEEDDPAFARQLASLADLFVDDAFAEAHRVYASNVGDAAFIPSYAGLLMQEEVERLSEALVPPSGSVAVIGGAKFETKQPLIEKLLEKYETVCVAGALANDFLKARGLPVGISLVSDIPVPEKLAHHERIRIQQDVIVEGPEGSRTCTVSNVAADERIVDAGPETATEWGELLRAAPFVLWNGPLGVYEKGYTASTDALAQALAHGKASGVVGGGDTLAALAKFTFDDRIFCSTGGGAMLEFLTKGTLPALEVLKA